jgi:YD repeat-containing protein
LSKTFTYYDTGTVNTATDVNGAVTTYKYGAGSCGNSFPTEIDLPLNLITYPTWDANCARAVLVSLKDVNSNITTHTFGDANFWRATGASNPDGGSSTVTYNFGTHSPWNILTSSKENSATNVTSEAILDGFARTTQTQLTSDTSGTDFVDTLYDLIGRVASVSNSYRTKTEPTYGITQYAYDALNRTTSVTHPDSTKATFSYTGAATQATDEGSNSAGTTHVASVSQADGLGRLTSVCEVSSVTLQGGSGTPAACGQDIAATGFLTSYQRNTLGNIISVSQPGVNTRSFTYNDLSRLTQEINPESGTTTYSYGHTGQLGDLYQRTRPKQNQTGTTTVVTTYTLDGLHRPTGQSYNDGTTPSVTLSYDQTSVGGVSPANPKGRLTYAVGAGGTASTIFSYDTMGRVSQEWQCTPLNCGSSTFNLQYSYDYLGDITQLVNPRENATFTYSYDAAARLTKLTSTLSDTNHPGTLLTVNTYNALGEVQQATLGNGIVRNLTYDNRGRVKSSTDGSVYSNTLGYAPDSNILSGNDSINGNWTSYTFDDMGRIATSSKGTQAFSYNYDPSGNRWKQNVTAGTGPSPQYTFDANNHLVSYSYDAAGTC